MGQVLLRRTACFAYNVKAKTKPRREADGRCYYCRHGDHQVCGARWVRGAVCTRRPGHEGNHVFCAPMNVGGELSPEDQA